MFTIIKRWSLYLLAVFAGWIAVLSAVMLLSDAAPGAVAFFPSDQFVQKLPDGAGVVNAGRYWIAVRGDGPSLGLSLYRAGAVLVLPAGLPGCLPLGRIESRR